MNLEQFEKATDEELRVYADRALANVESGSSEIAAASLLRAQLFLGEIDRRHEATIVRRDFRLELAIIALIFVEIIIGITGIVIAVRESKEQAQLMERIEKDMPRMMPLVIPGRGR